MEEECSNLCATCYSIGYQHCLSCNSEDQFIEPDSELGYRCANIIERIIVKDENRNIDEDISSYSIVFLLGIFF